MATKKKKDTYDESSIKTLDYPYNVQTRPTMYIGELDVKGNTHLAKEVIDNSTDEALNGFGKVIIVEVSNKKGYCKVTDEGRGIPAKAIEKAFTKLHSSGKFDKGSYSVSGGLNGVGTTAVNALSKRFEVTTHNDGKEYTETFELGLVKDKLSKGKPSKKKGTIVKFYPNEEFMESTNFDIDVLKVELEMKSYVNSGIKYIFIDVDKNKKFEYLHKNGIAEYIESISNKLLVKPMRFGYTDKTKRKNKEINIEIDFALAWQNSDTEIAKSFCNSLYTSDGGTHITGFRLGIVNVIKKYIKENNILSKKDSELEISGDDVRNGLVYTVAVKHPDPLYDSQTKNKVTNSELQGSVQKAVNNEFGKWADEHPKEMKVICNKIITSAKASEAAKKAKELANKKGDNPLSIMSDLSKLASCISKNPDECELFIVEGRSAGGTAKGCRNKKFQAVYALRGKPLNANNINTIKLLDNKEYADLVLILTGNRGCVDENFDISKIKYKKIIIMADADIDGAHITSLLLSFFYKHMKGLIEAGYIYVAMPPLYSVLENKKRKYFLDDDTYNDYINDNICKKFNFVCNGKSKKKKENIIKLLNILEKYDSTLSYYSTRSEGINTTLLSKTASYIKENPTAERKEILKYIKSLGDLSSNKNSDGKLEISGLYNGDFTSFELRTMIQYAKELVTYMDEIKFPNSFEISYSNNGNSVGDISTAYETIIDSATPPSRVRLKGLGEMDADELWDTTMNPDTRNIMVIENVNDEKASAVMEDLLNSNSKYADRRKVFLLKNQEKAKNLD